MLRLLRPRSTPLSIVEDEVPKLKHSANRLLGSVVIAACALSGCASTPDPVIGYASSQPNAELGQEKFSVARSTVYLLRPSDKITVNVFREPDFSLENVQIGVEGNVSLPLLGSIPAAGMTAQQLEENVTERLANSGL